MKGKELDKSMQQLKTLSYSFACLSVIVFLVCVGSAAAHENDGGSVVVHMNDKGFEPKSVKISSSDTVVFENVDRKAHWPASDPHPTHTDYPEFDPKKPVEPNAEWSFTFDKPGEWTYHDHQNPYLKGEIIVASDGGIVASNSDDRAEEISTLDGFVASIKAFLLGTYKGAMALASGAKESASHDEERTESPKASANDVVDAKALPKEQYEEVKDRYAALVSKQDPKVALDQLREEIQTNDALARSCHPLTHEIGHAAYKKYQDFSEAMKYQDEVCNSGYIHGVIESRFSESDDVFTDMKTMCDQYPLGSFLSWQCYHGLGHGVMYYTANDLPRSLEMCDAFSSFFAQSNCSNGVFMENFNTDQKLHLSKYLKESDPFYPCAEQANRHKKNCYWYAPTYFLSLNNDDYAGALEWCNGTEAPFNATCAAGVGGETMKGNLSNPKLVESVCMSGRSEQVAPCIKGMVDLYINHNGSIEPARSLCGQLEVSNRQVCYGSVESNSKLFSK